MSDARPIDRPAAARATTVDAIAAPGHRTVLASAGSGKTFALTTRYLALVAGGAPVPGILATSFTRAAAGEIRDRILARAVELTSDVEQRRIFAEQAGLVPVDPRVSDAAVEAAFGETDACRVLGTVARSVHRMQVRTLDSLFGAVATAFALDLGLPAELRLADEVESAQLRIDAVRRMLDAESDGTPGDVGAHFLTVLRRLTQGRPTRSILRSIDEVVGGLLDLARETADRPEAWERIAEPAGRLAAKDLETVLRAMRPEPGAPPNAWWGAAEQAIEFVEAGDWSGFLNATATKNHLAGKQYKRATCPPELEAAYAALVPHAEAAFVAEVRERTIATRDLLARYVHAWDELRRERGVLTFADLVRAAGDALARPDLVHVAFRLDARIDHLLLDEFQDTSLVQWKALEPIAREIVGDASTSRSLFCVGDVKQSIYGWREAAPAVLERMPELLLGERGDETIERATLALSRRSAKPIMDFVNTVFGPLAPPTPPAPTGDAGPSEPPPVPALERTGVPAIVAAGRSWGAGFRPHDTTREEPGCVEIEITPGGHGRARDRMRVAAERAAEWYERHPGLTIGVLCRSNPNVGRVRRALAERELPSSGPGGAKLPETTSVGVLLDCLVLAEHPGDGPARFNVASSALGPRFVGRAWRPDEPPASGEQLSAAIARELERRGLAGAVADWTDVLLPDLDEREAARARRLIELAGELSSPVGGRGPARPGDLVRAADEAKVAEPPGASISVMTLHQSKGLEFDVVIFADLEDGFDVSAQQAAVVEREDALGPVRSVCRRVGKDLRDLDPEIERTHDAARAELVRDVLSLLYVGITRAKRHLLLLMSKAGTPIAKRSPSSGDLVLDALGLDRTGEEGVLATFGDSDWAASLPPGRRPVFSTEPVADRLELLPSRHGHWRIGSGAASASSLGHGADTGHDAGSGDAADALGDRDRDETDAAAAALGDGRLRDLLEPGGVIARARGTVVHALYEEIEWLEADGRGPDDDVLRGAARRVRPGAGAAWVDDAIADLRRQLASPAVRACLTPPAAGDPLAPPAGGRLEVRPELALASIEDGRLRRGIADRVVVARDAEGRAVAAEVVDYKTDRPPAADAAAADDPLDRRAAGYAAQLRAYRSAVARRFGLDPARVAARLLFVEAGRLYDVPAGAEDPPRRIAAEGG